MTAIGSIGIGSQVVANGWELIQEIDVDTAGSAIEFTGLNGAVDEGYKIELEFINDALSNSLLRATINGSTLTDTRQYLLAGGASISSSRSTANTLAVAGAGNSSYVEMTIPFADNTKVQKRTMRSEETRNFGASMQYIGYIWDITAPVTNITEIGIQSAIASGIGSPSRFRLYKLAK